MKSNILILLTIFISILFKTSTSFATDTQTTSSLVSKYCNSNAQLKPTSNDLTTNNAYFSTLSGYFKQDPQLYLIFRVALINSIINGQTSEIKTELINMWPGFALYLGPFLLGLLLTLVTWTCLICVFCKKNKKKYTTCQLWWPAIFLIVMALSGAVVSIVGITQHNIPTTINKIECGVSLLLDNVLNGNTKDNYTFLGVNNLLGNINNLTTNLSQAINDIDATSTSSINFIQSSLQSAINHTEYLGNGVTPNASFSLTYPQPTPNSTNVASAFGQVLGNPTISNTLSSTIYGNLTSAYSNVNSTFQPFISNIQTQNDTINNQTTPIISQINTINDSIISYQSTIVSYFNKIDSYNPTINLFTIISFSVITGVSFITLISVFILCIGKSFIRFILYISCAFMWLLALVTFIATIVLSIGVPVLYLGCNLANGAFNNSTQLASIVKDLNLNENISTTLNICLSSGNGQIINNFISTDSLISQIKTSIANINSTLSTTTFNTSDITNSEQTLVDQVNNFVLGLQNDIIYDLNSSNWFTNVSNQSAYIAVCSTDNNFPKDNLVPTVSGLNGTFINCTLPQSTCSGTIDSCSNGCIGLNQMMDRQTNVSTWQNNIVARYSGTCGNQISTDFTILYNNWYRLRVNNSTGIGSVSNRLTNPSGSLDNDVQNTVSTINSLLQNVNDTGTQIISYLNAQIDPNTGIIATANCRPIGDSISNIKDVICVNTFNSLYNIYILFGLCSYFALLMTCCITIVTKRYINMKKSDQQYIRPDEQDSLLE